MASPIRVRFDKNGFHHPLYGRLGRGKNAGRVYVLPAAFAEQETIKVPVMDHTSKPPRQIGEQEVTRYTHLPSTAEIIDAETVEELTDMADEGDEAAAEELAAIKGASRPTQSDLVDANDQMQKLKGEGPAGGPNTPKPQNAQERTTGAKPKRSSRRKAT